MTKAVDLLRERYLSPLKDELDLFIGVELEFPIVNLNQEKTDLQVCKDLLVYLSSLPDFQIEKVDDQGQPIQVYQVETGDRILFEVSYTTLELAFGPVKTIHEVAKRFDLYLTLIQAYLRERGHEIQGCGIHPQWDKNDNGPVASPRYQMLLAYLASAQRHPSCHSYPRYGSFICGNQVQLDVTKDNYLRVINAFTQIEAAKAYLFANSEFPDSGWDTKIARDLFWEESMHGLLPANVGVNPRLFAHDDDFLDYLSQSAIFTAQRADETYYFDPIKVADYLELKGIWAYTLQGQQVLFKPQEIDFQTHRSYQYQDLTTRSTIEFRSVCAQALDRTFAPTAFHLGLYEQLEALENYLANNSFFETFGRDYKHLRRQFSAKELSQAEQDAITEFSRGLLTLAKAGLERRGYGEEIYLEKIK